MSLQKMVLPKSVLLGLTMQPVCCLCRPGPAGLPQIQSTAATKFFRGASARKIYRKAARNFWHLALRDSAKELKLERHTAIFVYWAVEGGVEATQVAGEEQVGPGGADFDLGHIVKRVTLFRVHQIQFQDPVRQMQINSYLANTQP